MRQLHLHHQHFEEAEVGKFHGCTYPFWHPVPASVHLQDTGVGMANAPGGTYDLWKPLWGWREQSGEALCVIAIIFFSRLSPFIKG